MADNRSTLIGLGLLGGAGYLLFRPGGRGQAYLDQLSNFVNTTMSGQQQQAHVAQQQYNAIAPTALAGGGNLAAGVASGNPQQISQGIGQIFTGIVSWASGGYEGMHGNDIRDRFLDQFVQIYFPGAGTEQQYESMVRALAEIGIVGGAASAMIDKMYGIAPGYGFESPEAAQSTIEVWYRAFAAKGVILNIPQSY